jgi:uncharacterized protein YjiK
MGRIRLKVTGKRATGVPELSAVALARGRIYVADDEEGVALLGPKGATFRGPGVMEGVEGLTADGAGASLYAVSESSRRLVRLALGRGGEIADAEDLGKLPRLGGKKKCWEGAAWLPRAMNPEKRDRLLLVNESAPKALALFDPEDLDDHEVLDLPAELEDALDDVSDVAVEPGTGRVWLLSHESSAIGIAELVRANRALALESRGVVPLPVQDAQSEGIVFRDARRLLLASEKGGTLHTLSVVRR